MPKLNTKTSIVDYLKSIKADSSFSARKKLAEELWIENYSGTSDQNKQLLAWKINLDSPKWTDQNRSPIKADQYELQTDPITGEETFIKVSTSGRTETDELINKNKPENPTFQQYKPFEVSEEERKRIQETQKAYYDPFFNRERTRLTDDKTTRISSLNRLIQYSKTDLANDLAKTNKTFAKSMSKASNAYWRRWLLGSWLQKQAVWDTTEDFSKNISNREEYQQRKEAWIETQKSNIKTTFNRGLTNIDENQQAQTYFDTLKEIRSKQSEYSRQFDQSQQNVNFNLTKPTTPQDKIYSWTDVNKKTF